MDGAVEKMKGVLRTGATGRALVIAGTADEELVVHEVTTEA